MRQLLLSLALLAALAAPVLAVDNTATIENSGSTNAMGWRVTVHPSGTVDYQVLKDVPGAAATAAPTTIPKALADRFFAHLKKAAPLGKYPATHCMKSASFGVSEYIGYQGQKSPDVSCPDYDKRLQPVVQDARDIARVLKLEF